MTVQLIIFLVCLAAVIFFFKNFNASVYFIVMVDIFLRIITYLKINYLRDDAFSFFNVIPASVLYIFKGFDLGIFNEILVAIYIVVYIVFEVLLIRLFIKKKF